MHKIKKLSIRKNNSIKKSKKNGSDTEQWASPPPSPKNVKPQENGSEKRNSWTKTMLTKLRILPSNHDQHPDVKNQEENNFRHLVKQEQKDSKDPLGLEQDQKDGKSPLGLEQDQKDSKSPNDDTKQDQKDDKTPLETEQHIIGLTTSATKIANAWRYHRKTREQKGKIVSAKSRDIFQQQDKTCMHLPGISKTCPTWTRWLEVLEEVDMELHKDSLSKEPLSSIQKFEHAVGVVERIGKGSNSAKDHLWLILDTEHWLELYDREHRYGANLKVYHVHWLKSNTPENFFDWLDKGEGKDLDLKEISREKLNRQKVKYLDDEERKNYIVTFKDGLLIYKNRGEPVHTNPPENFTTDRTSTPPLPLDNPQTQESSISATPPETKTLLTPNHPNDQRMSSSSPTPSSQGSYYDDEHSTREKWIYVTDCKGNFYVGQKIKGLFHHSSFLAGGAICAAGGIKVRNGKLLEINPKSGHYKPSQGHFMALIERLKAEGVDVESENVKVVEPNERFEERLFAKFQRERAALYENIINTSREMFSRIKQLSYDKE